MNVKTKILIVEHDPNDIEMIQYELKNGKVNYISEIVQTSQAYESALRNFMPDIILSDFSLPGFSGPEAFRLRELTAPHTPFIFVSGTIGEENSIEFIKNGVTDFAQKEKLFALATKVKRALKEAKEKQQKIIAEQALVQSESLLAKAQQIAHVGSWNLDFAIGMAQWSEEACRIYGLDPSDNRHSFETWISFVHPDDTGYVMKLIKASQQTLSSNSFDHRIIRKDGTTRHIHSESKFELDTNGKPTGLYGIAQDITEKKEAEERLHKTHNRLLFLVENSPLGFIEWDCQVKMKSMSKRAEEILGWGQEEFINMQKDGPSIVFKEDLPAVLEINRQLLSGEKQRNSIQHRNYTKDGRIIWCEWFNSAMKDKDGKVETILSLVQDITEKKLAEAQLTFDRNNLNALINNTNGSLWSVDRDYKLISYNQPMYEIIKSSLGKEIKKGDNVLTYAYTLQQADIYKKFYERAFTGEVFTEIEYTSSPVEIWLETSFYPIREGDKIIGSACHMRNITERKKAENQIRELNEHLEERVQERTVDLTEANKALEAFNSMVSHDLRSPARAVTSFAEIIQQEHGETMKPEVKELFGFIEDSGNRMNAIIDDLLKLSKYGQEKLKLELVDMTRLVNGIWLNLSRNSSHLATLELAELCDANVDMSMMQQVLVNLLSNAIKYSSKKEKPVVKVWCEKTEENCTFFFKDNGAGFDMKNYKRLFGAFQRFHNVRDFEGTGVGLTLVKRIIEKHGGTVGAEAKVGEGAVFWFTLP